MSYQVVIVEDDPMIAMLNRGFVEQDRRFQVVREFRDGRAALHWLTDNPVDLLILDVFMPVLSGLELLRRLRAAGSPADAIMVTAANDGRTVDTLLKLGVVDYLVKPFTRERFQRALDSFCHHREAVRGSVTQRDLDLLFPGGDSASALPKGLQEQTLCRVRECLAAAGSVGCDSETLAAASGLSAVTVRRYLHYLVERGEADSRINYDTGGRPSVLYVARGEFSPAE